MTERRLAPSFLPTTAVLEMTYGCNHRCIFCSCPWEAEGGRFPRQTEMTTGEWKELIARLCTLGVTSLAFTGGEALLRADLPEIIAHAAACSTEHIETTDGKLVSRFAPPKLYLLSNGRRVDAGVLQMCQDYGVQLSLSLPGLETFAAHTGFDGADGVLDTFAQAKARGMFTVANITVTRLNLSEFERVISAALLAGAQQVLLNRFLPGGRGLAYADRLSLSAAELTQMLDTAEAVLRTAGRFGSLGTEVPRCLVEPGKYERLQVSTRCAAAIGFFVVGPSGYVRVCNHSPVNLNHVRELEALKRDPYWVTFTQKRYLPDDCSDCGQRHDCDGGCREAAHIVGGEVISPDVLLANAPRGGAAACRHAV